MKGLQLLYSAEQVRALDHCAIEEFKTPGIELMERAGAAIFHALRQRWPRARCMTVFCGGGNNGGDGFIVARLAHEAGLDVKVYLLTEDTKLKGDARTAFDKMTEASVSPRGCDDPYDESTEIIVDAMLGTGLSGEVEGPWKTTIEWINKQAVRPDCHVVAADIPSGLHADSGRVLGVAVNADLTVTFIGVKKGMLTAMGPDCCGELVFDDLQVNPEIYQKVPSSAVRLSESLLAGFFKPRTRNSHKGSYGHVLIVGGNHGMAGAVRLAGEAALRCGAGRVTVACRPENQAGIVTGRPELMCHGLESDPRTLTLKLKALMSSATCIVVGPGLGQDSWAQQIFSIIRETTLPTIVDADALNLLARDFDNQPHANWILTPHPGEASRLLGTNIASIQDNRFEVVKLLHARYGSKIILKGNGSLVIDAQGEISVCSAGNPGMASAGMGDVLSGVLAACIAQSGQLDMSAKVATLLHAMAADLAATQAGERGIIASDLFVYLRQLVNPQ